MPRPGLAAVLVTLVAACQSPADAPSATPPTAEVSEPEYLATPEQAALNLPFSEAVRVGDLLYLSGQVGNIPGTLDLAEGGIQGETRQTLENIAGVLDRYGSSMDRVVKCLVMLADIGEWPAMNEIYVEFFSGPKPARSAMGANGLALGARVEIECMAIAG